MGTNLRAARDGPPRRTRRTHAGDGPEQGQRVRPQGPAARIVPPADVAVGGAVAAAAAVPARRGRPAAGVDAGHVDLRRGGGVRDGAGGAVSRRAGRTSSGHRLAHDARRVRGLGDPAGDRSGRRSRSSPPAAEPVAGRAAQAQSLSQLKDVREKVREDLDASRSHRPSPTGARSRERIALEPPAPASASSTWATRRRPSPRRI